MAKEARMPEESRLGDVTRDIITGMDDTALMEKYQLTSKGLEELYVQLVKAGLLRREFKSLKTPRTRKIKSRQFLKDVQSGMSKPALMEKYGISSRTLQRLCKKLLEARALPHEHSEWELGMESTTMVQENIRKVQRNYVDFDLPVYEENDPEIHGKVRDITEEGVGILGLETGVDQVKKLVILGDFFGEVAPFEFEATCRWAKRIGPLGELRAGFQITFISEPDLRELRKLIHLIMLRGGK